MATETVKMIGCCEVPYCSAIRSCFHYCTFHHERICVQGTPIADTRCGLRDNDPPTEAVIGDD